MPNIVGHVCCPGESLSRRQGRLRFSEHQGRRTNTVMTRTKPVRGWLEKKVRKTTMFNTPWRWRHPGRTRILKGAWVLWEYYVHAFFICHLKAKIGLFASSLSPLDVTIFGRPICGPPLSSHAQPGCGWEKSGIQRDWWRGWACLRRWAREQRVFAAPQVRGRQKLQEVCTSIDLTFPTNLLLLPNL